MTLTSGRLSPETLASNFADLHPGLTPHEARVAADRCYFCHDAPCIAACPTGIDVPLFIRQIAAGQPQAAGMTILRQNILGGMCARVCPTETLCEEACVREAAEGKPVEIARLQRTGTDAVMATPGHPFTRADPTGKTVGVVGAGPAGLSAAHRLAMLGHDVTVYDARPKPGGLNEYGIAAYKTPDGFAAAEVDWLMGIGGIEIRSGQALGTDLTLEDLRDRHDAVLLAMGLAGVNGLGLPEAPEGVEDAVAFIARLRQSPPEAMAVGRNVVVIGGGMTAIDAAVQAKLLGAETVTIAYRRAQDAMPASGFEQDLAARRGVTIRPNLRPVGIEGTGAVTGLTCEYTRAGAKGLEGTGETVTLPADHVLVAIGQTLSGAPDRLQLEGGKIAVDAHGRTALPAIWAAGDCASGGNDLTVTAVAEGRDAALSIHAALSAE